MYMYYIMRLTPKRVHLNMKHELRSKCNCNASLKSFITHHHVYRRHSRKSPGSNNRIWAVSSTQTTKTEFLLDQGHRRCCFVIYMISLLMSTSVFSFYFKSKMCKVLTIRLLVYAWEKKVKTRTEETFTFENITFIDTVSNSTK